MAQMGTLRVGVDAVKKVALVDRGTKATGNALRVQGGKSTPLSNGATNLAVGDAVRMTVDNFELIVRVEDHGVLNVAIVGSLPGQVSGLYALRASNEKEVAAAMDALRVPRKEAINEALYYAGSTTWMAPAVIKATEKATAEAKAACEKAGITRPESLKYCIYDVLASGHYYYAKIEEDADQD
jgi:hypothetical protein